MRKAKPQPATDEQEAVNQASALRARAKSEITPEQYQGNSINTSHDFAEPLVWSYAKVEGRQEYTELLYIPGRKPFDLWGSRAPARHQTICTARIHHGRR